MKVWELSSNGDDFDYLRFCDKKKSKKFNELIN